MPCGESSKASAVALLQACKDFTRALKGISKPGDIANTRKLRAECRRATENWQVRNDRELRLETKPYRDPKLKKTVSRRDQSTT